MNLEQATVPLHESSYSADGTGAALKELSERALKELSERALRYGLSMARKAGGGLRPHIQASNSYEKRLLPEVVHPEDSGIGFAEVRQHC